MCAYADASGGAGGVRAVVGTCVQRAHTRTYHRCGRYVCAACTYKLGTSERVRVGKMCAGIHVCTCMQVGVLCR